MSVPQVSAAANQSGFASFMAASDRARLDDTTYVSFSNSAELVASRSAEESVILDLSDFFPHALVLPGSAGALDELWVVGMDGTGTASLRSYRDSDADGYVDPASEALLFSGERPDVIGSCSFDPASGTLYLLEKGSCNIYRARDTNGDRRPDALDAIPFVEGSWPGPPGGVLGDEPRFAEGPHPVTGEPFQFPAGLTAQGGSNLFGARSTSVRLAGIGEFTDADGNGVADSFAAEAIDR